MPPLNRCNGTPVPFPSPAPLIIKGVYEQQAFLNPHHGTTQIGAQLNPESDIFFQRPNLLPLYGIKLEGDAIILHCRSANFAKCLAQRGERAIAKTEEVDVPSDTLDAHSTPGCDQHGPFQDEPVAMLGAREPIEKALNAVSVQKFAIRLTCGAGQLE